MLCYLVVFISCGENGESSCPATQATLMMIINEEMTDLYCIYNLTLMKQCRNDN